MKNTNLFDFSWKERVVYVATGHSGQINEDTFDGIYGCLNSRQREAIDLYYVKGYSMPQMAEIMGISSAEGVELLDEAMKAFKRTSILRG